MKESVARDSLNIPHVSLQRDICSLWNDEKLSQKTWFRAHSHLPATVAAATAGVVVAVVVLVVAVARVVPPA